MSVSPEFIEFACELLGDVGPVTSRRMFGGAGLYADGVMFALIADEVIYLKVDDALKARLGEAGSGPFVYTSPKGKSGEMGYWRLPDDALDDPAEAGDWARAALSVALEAKAAKPPRKKKKKA